MSSKRTFLGYSEGQKLILPAILIAFIQLIGSFPRIIEQYYSTGIYPRIAGFLRAVTQMLPFSAGDIFYALFVLALLISLVKGIRMLFAARFSLKTILYTILSVVRKTAWIFICFYFLWGLNYYRAGIAYQLKMQDADYTVDDLCTITDSLIVKVNHYRRKLSADSVLPSHYTKEIFNNAAVYYKKLSASYPFLVYHHASVKPSMYNSLAAYIGFTGYYNPFSGEAQLRTDVPAILLPYTACHEIAHQLGYASETEANFVGYLAASRSGDDYFRYSVYLDLYKYARMQLFLHNTFPGGDVKLDTLVKADLRMINRFFLNESNKVAPVSMSLYNAYLKANRQQKGVNSYDDVIAYLINYYKKTGEL
ncbi:MAG: DUF3810 domain-containing protein [Sphingobacteriia bacterium]|nr:DUF3810 domain-containing protein [Sphingobacteriia bacterium]